MVADVPCAKLATEMKHKTSTRHQQIGERRINYSFFEAWFETISFEGQKISVELFFKSPVGQVF
jgi:hypothetical protein